MKHAPQRCHARKKGLREEAYTGEKGHIILVRERDGSWSIIPGAHNQLLIAQIPSLAKFSAWKARITHASIKKQL